MNFVFLHDISGLSSAVCVCMIEMAETESRPKEHKSTFLQPETLNNTDMLHDVTSSLRSAKSRRCAFTRDFRFRDILRLWFNVHVHTCVDASALAGFSKTLWHNGNLLIMIIVSLCHNVLNSIKIIMLSGIDIF